MNPPAAGPEHTVDKAHATPSPPYWEHYPHQADMGLRGVGRSPAEAFEQTALALSSVVTDLAAVEPATEVPIRCSAPDLEFLLVDWLNAIIYEMATRGMLFSRFHVLLRDGYLQGTAWGERVSAERHERTVEVKGATYTDLHVAETDQGRWLAQCVVDV